MKIIKIAIKTFIVIISVIVILFTTSYISGWGYFIIEDGHLYNYIGFGRKVTIPNNVTAIGQHAFYGNKFMKNITIPNSVTSIKWSAFADCISLKSIFIPDSVTSIDAHAFSGCKSLTIVHLPKNIEEIIGGTFFDCISLEAISIPEGVTRIGTAFTNCKSLKTLHIPKSVDFVGTIANCTALTSITVDELNPNYTSVDGVFFVNANLDYYDGINHGEGKFSPEKKILELYPASKKDAFYIVPDNVVIINWFAFADAKYLTEINIPDGVIEIRNGAFQHCSNLTDITIPESVKSIMNYAFEGCDNLTIHGKSGTYAEGYARSNNISFMPKPQN